MHFSAETPHGKRVPKFMHRLNKHHPKIQRIRLTAQESPGNAIATQKNYQYNFYSPNHDKKPYCRAKRAHNQARYGTKRFINYRGLTKECEKTSGSLM